MRIEQARRDPCAFSEYVWGFENAEIHRRMQQAMSEHGRLLFEAPRDHGKTAQSEARVLWELGRNPNLRIKFICADDALATERVQSILNNIDNNPKVREVFPNLLPAMRGEWTKHKFTVTRTDLSHRDASLEAKGIMSTITGRRADLIIWDDVCDVKNTILNPADRPRVKMAFKNTLNILPPAGGRGWYFCTPWHLDDCGHEIKSSNPAFVVESHPIDGDYTPLWPGKWGKDALLAREAEIGSREFNRNFRLIALSDEDALFPSHLIDGCKDFGLSAHRVPPEWPRFMGVDLAISKSDTADYTVIFVLAVAPDRRIVPIEVMRARTSSPETARALIAAHERHKPRVISVESNGLQIHLQQWLHEIGRRDLPIKAFLTGGKDHKKADPYLGLPQLAVEMENRNWRIPMGNGGAHRNEPGCACGICVWLGEMASFPVAKHDDTVMASWFAREAARSGSYEHAVSFPRQPTLAERTGLAALWEGV